MKKTTDPSDALDVAIEQVLRTAKPKALADVVAAARGASLSALIEATRRLLARETWPADIHAVVGQERNLFLLRRAGLLGTTLASELRDRNTPEADDLLLSLTESSDETLAGYARATVVGQGTTPPRVASTKVLERVATHFTRGDALMPAAAVALVRLGATDIGEQLIAIDDGSEAFAEQLKAFVQLAHEIVPLTPALWDLYRRRLAFLAVLLSDELESRASASVLLHALATSAESDCDDAIFTGLKRRLDRESAPLVHALLPKLEGRPIAKKLAKLLAGLASEKNAASKATKKEPVRVGTVATDGGPVVLATKKALAKWRGALPDMPSEGDYHDACALMDVGELRRAGDSVIVLRSHETSVDVVDAGDGSFWLVLAGAYLDAWADREALAFEPLALSIDARGGALMVLDAAYTPKAAGAEEDRVLSLRTKRVAYDVTRARTDAFDLVRLVPRG